MPGGALYTDDLDKVDAALTGVARVKNLTTALAESLARHRDLPLEGSYVVPAHSP